MGLRGLLTLTDKSMKLKYDAKKRGRIKHGFISFTSTELGWWFDYESNSWQNPPTGKQGYSSDQYCRSVRAFRRKLKKAPLGVRFRLTSRWIGYDVYGFGTDKSKTIN